MKVRLPVALAVAAFLLLAVVASKGSSGIPTGIVRPGTGPTVPIGDGPLIGPPGGGDPFVTYSAGAIVVLVFVAALFGLAILVFMLGGIRFHRRRKRMRVQTVVADDVVDGGEPWLVRAGQRALLEMDRKTGGPPSDAVVAAWIHLERSAAETGLERQPHQTPTEFTAAVLAGQNADEQALSTLRKLYHRARFGQPGSVTDDDARQARRALEQLA
nr:DUF4129 domain-containing protein [Kibdelosporangium sp. MJ126-NF4]CEL19158.1 hypothetical protein [Kibdelosporangium sp. MJ126-NF4]CTQ95041.1 hypothetical protein [Kibdelosporangium sp. MJ126-NF4]